MVMQRQSWVFSTILEYPKAFAQRERKENAIGLDMYALTCRHQPAAPVDFDADEDAVLLHGWRKHPNLQGWMERLYREKGGVHKYFNNVNLMLTTEDLDQLEADVRARRLPHTEGFFFGVSTSEDEEDDLLFITKAREALKAGLFVFYDSWW
ncbi:uncharacterized protein FOMMEDRAFT_29672 [Fomitiporia mediterranea MF3/22]|uniref:uncharacterized protein n=1 Tax=Fomitiporia mediterranea (strain MF3/22) TaxID=694068 RepID=UPI00044089CE|nr:uncharacterized protein FOMMEDRAFT_29672 [Fomitiporia mediterranea MF3/22]EJD00866.1 hypothetical protein FOMMEDRAFT_29672 [Fomitiporia mediterranea MF3/22]